MKRPLALVLTIAIFAAVAVCFLRPIHGSVPFIVEDEPDKVYTFAKPEPLELIGRDADLIQAEYVSTSVSMDDAAVILSIKSVDDACYTLGASVYENGIEVDHKPPFITERYENGEWRAYADGWWFVSYVGGVLGNVRPAFSSSEALSESFKLSIDEPGRYRITFYFRDYIPASEKYLHRGGSSGDGLYEASFEYEVPARKLLSTSPRVANFSMRDYSDVSEWAERFGTNVAQINMLITNSHIGYGYFQRDKSRIEMLTDSGEYIPADEVQITYGEVINCTDRPEPFDEYCVRPVCTNIWGWEYGAEYRLSMTFTENEDGSGEQYTLTLNLRFDE